MAASRRSRCENGRDAGHLLFHHHARGAWFSDGPRASMDPVSKQMVTTLLLVMSGLFAAAGVVAQDAISDGVGYPTFTAAGLISIGAGAAVAWWRREERRNAVQRRRARRADVRQRRMTASLVRELNAHQIPLPEEFLRLLETDADKSTLDADADENDE